jgi:hypothetical protein
LTVGYSNWIEPWEVPQVSLWIAHVK